jgi:transposase
VLKALAALLVPVETAIAARNGAATQVHADETTWRVYEHVQDKTGHKWWLWVFIAQDTIVFRMDPTRSNSVVDTHFGITENDREAGALPEGRRLVLSSDFFVVYQSLARLDGVQALWCWAHLRRYFIRAGDAHAYLRPWRDKWVARIADLYVAHQAMAAAEPDSPAYTTAVFQCTGLSASPLRLRLVPHPWSAREKGLPSRGSGSGSCPPSRDRTSPRAGRSATILPGSSVGGVQ